MSKVPLAVIDFETLRIEPRPDYPPKPVGLAILEPGKRPVYLAWGHPYKNNCAFEDAYKTLHRIYERYCVVMHNATFDLEVAEKFFDLPLVPPHGFCDTMLEAFLYNPRFPDMKLKNLANNLLDMPPVEEQRLHEWILDHVFTSQKGGRGNIKIWDHRPRGLYAIPPSQAGGFIGYAPGDLVGKYAKGDVARTKKLHNLFMSKIKKLGMMEQWDVEHRVAIKAMIMSRGGVRIDVDNLAPDLETAKKKLATAERNVYKKLGEINLDSPKQKIEAFESKGLVSEWEYTEKGNPKTSIDSLMRVCTDKKLVKDLNIYSKYNKIIGTYMQPWLASALKNNGYFYPWYNTIKGEDDRGTYTGRFSSNFQQVPRRIEDVSLKGLPFLRNYVIADKKQHVLFNRDFSGQEVRILAHFEDGVLLSAFNKNPELDGHSFVNDLVIKLTGVNYGRSAIKACNFLIIYGGGVYALSQNLGVPYNQAEEIYKAHGDALVGLSELKNELRLLARRGEMFKTAGGRWYDFEEGFEYVALNTLIQGSAADHSKRALLNISDMIETKGYDARLMLTVHDEFMISGPARCKKKFMTDFREAMEYDELFDLPMLTDGKIGKCWGKMEKVSY